jgi:hypothetical protein
VNPRSPCRLWLFVTSSQRGRNKLKVIFSRSTETTFFLNGIVLLRITYCGANSCMQGRVASLLAVHRTIRPTPQQARRVLYMVLPAVDEGDAATDHADDAARQNRRFYDG